MDAAFNRATAVAEVDPNATQNRNIAAPCSLDELQQWADMMDTMSYTDVALDLSAFQRSIATDPLVGSGTEGAVVLAKWARHPARDRSFWAGLDATNDVLEMGVWRVAA